MDVRERKEKLQLELAQIQALMNQLERQHADLRVQALKITGQIELLDSLDGDETVHGESQPAN